MSDLTIDLRVTKPVIQTAQRARPVVDRLGLQRVFAAALSLSLVVCLTVPSSEIRAKSFKLGVIAKSMKSRAGL